MTKNPPTATEERMGSTISLNRGMLTVSIMAATVMQTLDSTIANVALPHMQGSLSASQDEIAWILTSYIIASAVATPLTGWMSARLGVKRLLSIAVAGFTIASALCGLSGNLSEIVVARLLQGVFGAALVPLSQSITLDISPPDKQGSAIAIWGMGVMVGPILGPTLGGWLTDSYSWRWVFFINVPIGIAALLGILTFMPARATKSDAKFDVLGFATLSIGIAAFQAMLDRGEQLDWFGSVEVRVEALLAVVSFLVFVLHTVTAGERRFFRYELLRDINFATGTFFIFLIGAVMYATRALLPTMLQNIMSYPATTTGLVTAPSGLGTMFAMMVAGRILKHIDARLILLVGFLISAFALWQMMHYAIALSPSDIVWPGVIQGAGVGLVFVPLSALSFSTLKPELRAEGTAIYSLMRNIGSSIGISITQTLLTRNTFVAHANIAEGITVYNPAVQQLLAGGESVNLALLNQTILQQATMIAYLDNFKLMFVATLMVLPLIAFIRQPGHCCDVPSGDTMIE